MRAEFQKQIKQLDKDIQQQQEAIKELENERDKLKSKISEIDRQAKTEMFLGCAHELTDENSRKVWLNSSTGTTRVMDSFNNSDKQFLVFRNMFAYKQKKKWVSLVVVRKEPGISYINTRLTMTDLKKECRTYISKQRINRIGKNSRIYPLLLELYNLPIDALTPEKSILSFEKPCLLGGQTYSDRTGYGWEYHGGNLVYVGTEYGETTKFLIIGAIVENYVS